MSDTEFQCPACVKQRLSLLDFDSLMVLRADIGMFTVSCPACHNKVSLLRPIPPALFDEVRHAAESLGAGMGMKDL